MLESEVASRCNESKLQTLVLHFFSGLNMNQDEEINLTWHDQKILLDLTILHPLVKTYPMNRDYCKAFLRKLMTSLEKGSDDVHDELYNTYCTLIQDSNEKETDFCFKHYMIKGDTDRFVTIKESSNLIIDGTTGLRTWEAAVVLADWALSNKCKFKGKRVLELGSGLGMTGTVVSKLCAPEAMCFSDCHPRVLSVLEENVLINFPEVVKSTASESLVKYASKDNLCDISVLRLDWNSTDESFNHMVPDVVIGADIVYDSSTFNAICNVFDTLLRLNHDLEIYLVSTVRNEKTTQEFIDRLYKRAFKIDMINHKSPIFICWNDKQEYYIMKIYKL